MEVIEHEHLLNLIDLQLEYPYFEEEEEEYDEDGDEDDDLITKQEFRCPCDRCGQEITWYHRYYYKCSDSCDYSLHKFCAELPATLKHRSHGSHVLTLLQRKRSWRCNICRKHHEPQEIRYRCAPCDFDVDVNCAVAMEEKRIYHPSHPHPLVRTSKPILCECNACGKEHKGIFYICITCSGFFIHIGCAFLQKKLSIKQTTNDIFSHTHPLTLAYSFPEEDQEAKFNPRCRVCDGFFDDEDLWIYKCEKCRYYTHVDCATSRGESFMSIFLKPGLGKTTKNFEDADHPDLLHLPFPDQTCSLLKHLFSRDIRFGTFESVERNLTHICHQHPLILVCTQSNDIARPTSSRIRSLSCHNPMKKIELLCEGCVRPIMSMPFNKCANEDECCSYVLHEWCTRLPTEVQNHPGHPQHTLVLMPNVPHKFFNVFYCAICNLPCNGFAYCCVECEYYIDVTCGFIPEKVTHEGHPNHLLSRVHTRPVIKRCRACLRGITENGFSFSCRTCEFNLHPECALLLPQTIRHKFDKHPMSLSYFPIENHKSEYFCEICEVEFDPEIWFYHCYECVQSMHSDCAPLILECETAAVWRYRRNVYEFVNIKFGGIHIIKGHQHPLSFVLGSNSDGQCTECDMGLHYEMIFKCMLCKFAIDYKCCERLSI